MHIYLAYRAQDDNVEKKHSVDIYSIILTYMEVIRKKNNSKICR
jgi:hypothetical protein